MNRTCTAVVALAVLAINASACGVSPLLNHEDASSVPPPPEQRGQEAGPRPTEQPSPATPGTPTSPASGANCPLAFPNSGLCASLTWSGKVKPRVETSFELRFWSSVSGSAEGPYQDVDGTIDVILWMPSMGHDSRPVTITPLGNGVYSATHVYFIMGGAWDVHVQIKRGDELVEQALSPIQL